MPCHVTTTTPSRTTPMRIAHVLPPGFGSPLPLPLETARFITLCVVAKTL